MSHEIRVPRLGWSMEVGTFLGWRKQDGEWVKAGETLFELEGEKAAQEIEAMEEGFLRIAPDAPAIGSQVPVGALIGYLTEEGERSPYVSPSEMDAGEQTSLLHRHEDTLPSVIADAVFGEDEKPSSARPLSPSARRRARELGLDSTPSVGTGKGGRVTRGDLDQWAQKAIEQAIEEARPAQETSGRVHVTPRARRVAKELGVDCQTLTGTGRGGRVRECDVRAAGAAAAAQESAPAPSLAPSPSLSPSPGLGTTIPHSKLRRVIARSMLASHQQTAPVTLTTLVNAANLVNLRDQFKQSGAAVIPTFNDLILKLTADVLTQHLTLAARWEEDAMVLPAADELHLGLAVHTDQGLVVPVLRQVNQRSLLEVARQSAQLIQLARSKQLTQNHLTGACFTVTNLGTMGIDSFTPMIHSPEAAILGVGAIRREPIVGADDQIVPGLRMTLSLTFDHRLNDGVPAAKFLASVRESLENPVPRLMK